MGVAVDGRDWVSLGGFCFLVELEDVGVVVDVDEED